MYDLGYSNNKFWRSVDLTGNQTDGAGGFPELRFGAVSI